MAANWREQAAQRVGNAFGSTTMPASGSWTGPVSFGGPTTPRQPTSITPIYQETTNNATADGLLHADQSIPAYEVGVDANLNATPRNMPGRSWSAPESFETIQLMQGFGGLATALDTANPATWAQAMYNGGQEQRDIINAWQPNKPWSPNDKTAYQGYNPNQTVGALVRNLQGSTGGGIPIGGSSALLPLKVYGQGQPQSTSNNDLSQLAQDVQIMKEAVIGGGY
jgi:hypothetical protein